MKTAKFCIFLILFCLAGYGGGIKQATAACGSPSEEAVYQWLYQQQDSSPTGLLGSQEDDSVSTYNNALAVMVFTWKQSDLPRAEQILSYFNDRVNETEFDVNGESRGFFQYRDIVGEPDTTGNRWMGDNAWLLMAIHHYKAVAGNSDYDVMMDKIVNLLMSLQQPAGYIASGWEDGDRRLNLTGHTEGNLDAYKALLLHEKTSAAEKVKEWLYFAGGHNWNGADGPEPLDIHSWRVSALGSGYGFSLHDTYRFQRSINYNNCDVIGYMPFPDLGDNIWSEGTGQMAVAFYKAGYDALGDMYTTELEKLFFEPSAFPKTETIAYMALPDFGDYNWVDTTKGHLAGVLWYLFAKKRYDPFEGQLIEYSQIQNPVHRLQMENYDNVGGEVRLDSRGDYLSEGTGYLYEGNAIHIAGDNGSCDNNDCSGWVEYHFNALVPLNNSSIRIRYAEDMAGDICTIYLDGNIITSFSTEYTGTANASGWDNYIWTDPSPVGFVIEKGMHTLRIEGIDERTFGFSVDVLELTSTFPQFSVVDNTVMETAGSVPVTVIRTGDLSGTATVDYTTESANNTATSGSDYTPTGGTLNWAVGETEASFNVDIINDNIKEPLEIIYLNLSNPVGAVLGIANSMELTIRDDDAQYGALQFAAPSYSFAESAGTVTLSVLRTGGSDFAVGVDYASSDDTATAGNDYTAVAGTLSWSAGDGTAKSFNLTLLDDAATEGSESFTLTLSNPVGGATLGANNPVTITINDDEGAGAFEFDKQLYRFDENVASGVATLRVKRLGGNTGAVCVDYATTAGTATDGVDFNARNSPPGLCWADGDSSDRFIQVPVADDYLVEANENFYLSLNNPTGGAELGSIADAQVLLVEDMGDSGSNAVCDLDNDGSVDVLFRHNITGENKVWLLNCGVYERETTLYTVNRDWRAVGCADFDGDGNNDIVLRNQIDDRHLVWFMNGDLTRRTTAFLPSVNYTWESQGIADFSLDGKPDVVRRNTQTGNNLIWLMGGGGLGTARIGVGPLGAETDLNWRIVGSGDFNADGKTDLMWRNTLTGANRVWLMNRFTYLDTAALPSQALQWKVVGVADFTCDGKPDILWRHQLDGRMILWVMEGVIRSGAVGLPTLDVVW